MYPLLFLLYLTPAQAFFVWGLHNPPKKKGEFQQKKTCICLHARQFEGQLLYKKRGQYLILLTLHKAFTSPDVQNENWPMKRELCSAAYLIYLFIFTSTVYCSIFYYCRQPCSTLLPSLFLLSQCISHFNHPNQHKEYYVCMMCNLMRVIET